MENLDFEIRNLYQRILIEVLSIETFLLDNLSKEEITKTFLMEDPYCLYSKEALSSAIQVNNSVFLYDEIFFEKINYENFGLIEYIFSETYSLFENLSNKQKMFIIALDLCSNSNLRIIFHSKNTSLNLGQRYQLFSEVLNMSSKDIKNTVKKLLNKGVLNIICSKKIISTTDIFTNELVRLSTIPSFKLLDLSDFDLNCENNNFNTYCNIETYTGEKVSSYIYSKFNYEKIRFWYVDDLNMCITLLTFFYDNKMCNEYIWINNYSVEFGYKEKENDIILLAKKNHSKLIVYNENLENPFGTAPFKIKLKEFIFEKYENEMKEQQRSLNESNFSKYSNMDQIEQNINVIAEEDFQTRYYVNINGYTDTSNINPRIKEIYNKLNNPCTYLKANREMFLELEDLINQHPNILNKDLLYAYIKNAILFSKDNIVKTTPLLLVGNPGCGKTLFCRQLRQLFNQDNDIFIPMGSGLGITGLLGSTPEYKNASNGKILSSIWESLNNENCLNPLIVLDEIEKACFSSKISDVNQNVYPTLLQLFGEENMIHFKDNFFEVPVNHFFPNFICTANSIESIPAPLLDRVTIIKFRDYTEEEFKSKIIPFQYESFRSKHNSLVPDNLSEQEIDIIYKMCNGKTRQIHTAINRYLSVLFDIDGNRKKLDSITIENLYKSFEEILPKKQIGFCR